MMDWADEIAKAFLDNLDASDFDVDARPEAPFRRLGALLRKAKADGRLSGVNQHSLTSAELKVIERHCDWQAFKHAMGALYNFRAAEIEKGNA